MNLHLSSIYHTNNYLNYNCRYLSPFILKIDF